MLTEREMGIILERQKEAKRKKEDEIALKEIRKYSAMKFGKLEPGDKFIFLCAVGDGNEKMIGIDIYMKLECSVFIFSYSSQENLKPLTAVNIHSGYFMGIPEDTEVLKIKS